MSGSIYLEEVGLSSGMLLHMLQELEQCGTEMHGIMVERHGKVVLECWWVPYESTISKYLLREKYRMLH